jgi:hypothetical protein
MVVLFIPLLMLFIAPALQIILSRLRIKGKVRLPLVAIFLLALLLGFMLSISAFFVSISGLSPGIKCLTGFTGLIVLGILITLVTTPLIAIVSFIMFNKRHKTSNTI